MVRTLIGWLSAAPRDKAVARPPTAAAPVRPVCFPPTAIVMGIAIGTRHESPCHRARHMLGQTWLTASQASGDILHTDNREFRSGSRGGADVFIDGQPDALMTAWRGPTIGQEIWMKACRSPTASIRAGYPSVAIVR